MTDKTTLAQAHDAWEDAERYEDVAQEKGGNAHYRGKAESARQDAAILAQLAQAEALTRIAEVLETMLEERTQRDIDPTYGVRWAQ